MFQLSKPIYVHAPEQGARKVVHRAPHRQVGYVHWPSRSQPLEHESNLERQFVLVALLWPGLGRLRSQPRKLNLVVNGKPSTYTPDFSAVSGATTVVVEVKPRSDIPRYTALFNASTQLLMTTGDSFAVIDEEHILVERANRAAYLKRFSEYALAAEHKTAFAQHFEAGPCSVLRTIAAGFTRPEIDIAIATGLIGTGPDLGASHDSELCSLDYARDRWSFWDWFDTEPWSEPADVQPEGDAA